MPLFDFKGNVENLDVDCATSDVLGTLFDLEPSSVKLLADGRVIKQDGDGIFPGLRDGVQYRVIGTSLSAQIVGTAAASLVPQTQKPKRTVSLLIDKQEVQKIASEVQKDTSTLVKRAEVLSSAPLVALLVRGMCLLAVTVKDVSLINDGTKRSFEEGKLKRLKVPGSLYGSLMQLKASICSAMKLSSEKMLSIQLALSDIPHEFRTTRDVLEEIGRGETDGAEEAMDIVKRNLQRIANSCRRSANAVKTRMDDVIEEIDELSMAIVATNGFQNHLYEDTKRELERMEEVKKSLAEEKARVEEEFKEQKEVVEKAKKEYEKQMKKFGDFGTMFSLAMADCLTKVISSIGDSFGSVTSISKSVLGSVGQKPQKTATEKLNYQEVMSLAGVDALASCAEQSSITLESPQLSENSRQQIITSFEAGLASASAANDPVSNSLKETVKNVVDRLRQPGSHTEMAAALKSAVAAYRAAMVRLQKENEKKNQSKTQLKIEREKSKQTLMDTFRMGLTSAQATKEREQDRYDALRKEQHEANRVLEEAILKLKSLDMDKVNLEDVIAYLKQATGTLEELKSHWENLASFFDALAAVVKDRFSTTIHTFLSYVFSIADSEDADEDAEGEQDEGAAAYGPMRRSTVIQGNMERISRQMLLSVGLAMQVERVAQIYVKISDDYVMPVISGEQKTFALTKEQAKAELAKIDAETKGTQQKVDELLKAAFFDRSSGISEALNDHQNRAVEYRE